MVNLFKQRDRGYEAGGELQRALHPVMSDQALVALLLVLLIAQTAAKLYLALSVNLLWDEAHFVVAGRHPDWGYPDIPAGPALLAASATALFGDTVIGLRVICLAAAQLLPLAVYFLTRQFCARREAVWAAIITVFLPTTGLLGAFYYPEAFLQLALVAMLAFLVRAINDDRWSDWLLTGVIGAFGLFMHYRFALAGAGVIIFLLTTAGGRQLFLRPGLYLAGVIALAGLAPAIWYNIRENFAAIEFQAAARHRWAFWPPGLLHTLEQALIVTPIFFAGLIGAVRVAALRWRESEATAGLVLIVAASIVLPYTLMAPFNKAYLYHWPFMAYAPLIAFMPQALIGFVSGARSGAARVVRGAVVASAPALALMFAMAGAGLLLAWAHPNGLKPTYQRFLTGDYERWSALIPPLDAARRRLGAPAAPIVMVGHIPAVRLQFPGERLNPLFVAPDTDDPMKGFDALRSRWGDDLDALAQDYPGELALIAIPDAGYVLDQGPDIDLRLALCRRFAAPRKVQRVELAPGRRSIDVYAARVRPRETQPPAFCGFLPTEYMFKVERGATLPPEGQNLAGIAVHPSGVTRVEVLLDGASLGEARLGLDPTNGRVSRALAFDPRYPKVFWDFYLKNENLAPGAHRLAIQVTRGDGSVAIGGERVFYVGTGLETMSADILETLRNAPANLPFSPDGPRQDHIAPGKPPDPPPAHSVTAHSGTAGSAAPALKAVSAKPNLATVQAPTAGAPTNAVPQLQTRQAAPSPRPAGAPPAPAPAQPAPSALSAPDSGAADLQTAPMPDPTPNPRPDPIPATPHDPGPTQ